MNQTARDKTQTDWLIPLLRIKLRLTLDWIWHQQRIIIIMEAIEKIREYSTIQSVTLKIIRDLDH